MSPSTSRASTAVAYQVRAAAKTSSSTAIRRSWFDSSISSATTPSPAVISPAVSAIAIVNWRVSEPVLRRRRASRCAAATTGAPAPATYPAVSQPSVAE